MEYFKIKSSDYMAYLVARGHSAKLVKSEFDKLSSIPRHESYKRVEKSLENKVMFGQLSIHEVAMCFKLSIFTSIHHFSIISSQMLPYLLLINNANTSKIY